MIYKKINYVTFVIEILLVIPQRCNQEQTTFLTWNWIQKQKILHTLREWILQYLIAYNLLAPFAGGGGCQSLIAQISLSLSPQ